MPDSFARLQVGLGVRYSVQRELGAGGMATVYLAEDLKHHRPVAVKVLKPELAQAIGSDRFLREVEISAGLQHPHILPLYDSGEAEGFLYYVMPYAEGESLRDRLNREKQLPLDDALQIAREVAYGLSYAHGRGVVHRDIKPDNILLESGYAVVADFGIARAITEAGSTNLTATGMAIGTPAYMSPEQAAGSRDLDGRSDLYSLGCVLYEMLAGQPPFTGPTVESIVYQHLASQAPDITSLRPTVSAGVAAALQRALAKTPADRFNSVGLFAEALGQRERAETVVPAPASAGARSASPRRRRAAVIGAVTVLAIAVTTALLFRGGRTKPGGPPRTALAVLQFQNLSADPAHAYFAGGLHDELLTQLSKVTGLSLRGRTSVMGYAESGKTIRQIAAELQVGAIVEGSVQVVGGRLRVNVQLIDAAADQHLWAESYDRALDDAFAIQSDVARRVVAAVGAALGRPERQDLGAAPTANAEAYRLYLQGRDYYRRPGRSRQDLESAQHLYERAIALDPAFALAYAHLSQTHGLIHWERYDPSPRRVAQQREAAEAALRFAPALPQAHVAMGLVHYWGRRDYRRALHEFGIALEGLPNDAGLVALVGYVHRRLGNWGEVQRAFERATELNPRDANLFWDLGCISFGTMRRYAEALRACEAALRLAPDFHNAAIQMGLIHTVMSGRLDSLRAALQRIPSTVHQRVRLFLWERRSDSLLQALASGGTAVFAAQDAFFPRSLYAGWAHQLRGDGRAARAAFSSALATLDSVVDRLPDDERVHAARGLALAGLHRREESLREARWLTESAAYRDDAFSRPSFVASFVAQILAQAGEPDAALEEIERLLAGPSWTSVHTLRLDPLFDPIREHPRFQELLTRYASQ